MNSFLLFKKGIFFFFLSILLWRCTEETKFFRGKDPTDVFYQNSSNLYTDVFVQNTSKNFMKTFSQNTIAMAEEKHSQVTLKTNREIFSQNTIQTVEQTHSQITLKEHKEEFSQNTLGQETRDSFSPESLEILWVIDNSQSMEDKQRALAKNFNSFIADFLDQNMGSINFKMAIITTDSSTNRVTEGKLTSAEAKKDRAAFENYFKKKINVGIIQGDVDEKGLKYSEEFLKKNRSWIHPNAYLIIIYVSDEDDFSPYTVEYYVSNMQSFKIDPKKLRLFSIVELFHDIYTGHHYIAASRLTNGLTQDINSPFNIVLNNIKGNVVDLLSSFVLSKNNVDAGSIKVYVNNVLSPQDKWIYKKEQNTVFFKRKSIPPKNANITIHYQTNRLSTSFPLKKPINSDQLRSAKVFINNSLISNNKWEYRDQKIHFKTDFVPEESARIKIVYNAKNLLTSFPLGSSLSLAKVKTMKVFVNDTLIPNNKWEYLDENINFIAGFIPEESAKIRFAYNNKDLLTSFSLATPITPDKLSTVKVFVNNSLVSGNNWEYRNQKIHFKTGSIPEASARIEVISKKGNLLTSFPLESSLSPAIVQTMKVFVNNTRISNNRWEYRDERIHFTAGFIPAENAKIKFAYKNKDLLASFPLTTPIDPNKLNTAKVFVNDVLIPKTYWEYRDASIKFKENSIPSSAAKIKVKYKGSSKLFTSFSLRNKITPSQIDVYVNGAKVSSNHWEHRDYSIHFKENHIPEKEAKIRIVYKNEVTLRTYFYLDHPLDTEKLDTVDITVNGNYTPRNGWEYRNSTNTVHFKDGFVPPEGAEIQIVYTDL